ncbi:MAG: AmmeMemoRadiSam system protein A [Proteobacteria bacterium]|nr:AmmeMemoRadiSam system protein A [Pseudomonadota bacterium]MBU1611586.1 AmmeMemoRadiSam system protein A [Pseudomonadota bacterium]
MTRLFTFMLSDEEKMTLKELVKRSISSKLEGTDDTPADPGAGKLTEPMGAFVTLTLDGKLRGCIGNLQAEEPLYKTIWNMARSAAFNDPRFPALTREEFERLEIEISILSHIAECRDKLAIEVGRHGVIIQRGEKSGLLLPQVPVQWGWNREQFLEQTCHKAGLDPSVLNLTGTNIFWFEAVVF